MGYGCGESSGAGVILYSFVGLLNRDRSIGAVLARDQACE